MRNLVTKLQTTLTDFIAQREAMWLLVTSAIEETPLVFKLLGDCERNSRSEVFLLFGAPFLNAEQYAEEIVAQFCAEYRALDETRVARHHPPLETLAAGILGNDPGSRIVAVIDAARALLPTDGVYRLVCAFWPLDVADAVAYRQFLEALITRTYESAIGSKAGVPWKQVVRLIGCEIKGFALRPKVTSVLRTESDFSAAALQRSLQQTIDDLQQPEAVRMQALLTQATIDQTHDRVAAAIGKYGQVLTYYQKQKNTNLQTVVLIQLGEAYQQQQRLSAARACYEQALIPATALPVPLCAARLARNLAEVALLQQRYADAVIAYQTWHRIAEQLGDREGVAAALAKLAALQERLHQTAHPNQRPDYAEVAR